MTLRPTPNHPRHGIMSGMHQISALAGLALGIPIGALATLALAHRIRPKPAAPNVVQIHVDDTGAMRLGRHPSMGSLTEPTPADVEIMRDTRPVREWGAASTRRDR